MFYYNNCPINTILQATVRPIITDITFVTAKSNNRISALRVASVLI